MVIMATQLNSTDVQWNELRVSTALSIVSVYQKTGTPVGSDAAEAGTTDTVINATAHLALAGDQVIFTNGAQVGEAGTILSVTANTITLTAALSGAPVATDPFNIERPQRQSTEVGAKIVTMINGTNQTVDISYDGVVLHDRLVSGASRSFDYKSNNLHLPKGHALDDTKGWVYIKATSTTPTSGEFTFASAE